MASNGAIHVQTRWHPRVAPEDPREDHFLSNTDGGQNRANIGISGKSLALSCHESTYLPGLYGQGPLKGPNAQE